MSSKTLLNAIKAGLFALLLTPIIASKQFYFPFVGPKSLYFMAIVEVVFFLWIILIWKWKQCRPDFKNPVVAAVLAFLAISLVSAIFGANFSVSFWSKFERMGGVLMLAHLAALVVVASSVLRGKDWNWLFGASAVVAAFVAVDALFDRSAAAANGGFLGNDSFWGAYILLNIFLAFYLFFSKEWRDSKKLRIFSASAFFLLAICLLIESTPFWLNLGMFQADQINPNIIPSAGLFRDIFNNGARAAKISLVFGLSLVGILWLATRKNLKLKLVGRGILAVSIVSGLAIIVLSTLPGNPVYSQMQARFGEGTIYGRAVVWKIAWQGFLERPLFGWGPENFDLVFTKFYNPCFGTEKCAGAIWYDRAHNVIFDTLVTTGIIGFVGYLSIFGAALWMLWKKYKDGVVDFFAAGVFTALLAAYFLQDLTVFDTVDSYLIFFLALAFIASLLGRRLAASVKIVKEKGSSFFAPERRLRWYEWAALGIAFLICFNNFVIGSLRADYLVVDTAKSGYLKTAAGQIIKQEAKPFGSNERLNSYQDTLAASPMGKYQISEFFGQVFLQALQDKTREIPADRQIKEFNYLTDLLGKNIREDPLDYKARVILGGLYTFWGLIDNSKYALAEATLQDAIKLAPSDQEGYWNLAQTKLFEMQIDDALSLAHQALALEPDHPKSQTMVFQIESIKKKIGDKLPAANPKP